MENVITRSKFVNETIPIVFDFSDQLSIGESVSSCTITVSLFTGIDNNPSNILYHTPIITGNVVEQNIRLGIPGCIYEISFLVVGSTGTHCEKVTSLAILPQDGTAIPSFTVIYETSCLYPYEFSDSLSSGIVLVHGNIGYIGLPEGINSSIAVVYGSILGSLVSYADGPEGLQSNIGWITGTIGGSFITYNSPHEDLQSNVAWMSGSVVGTFISYACPPENITSGINWISGSIS